MALLTIADLRAGYGGTPILNGVSLNAERGDIISLIGGAVITETIFGWNGMGKMFVTSLHASEPDPVMAYVMITGALAMVANLVADFLYALLDPRIRVNA